MQESCEHVQNIIHDQAHFPARWLKLARDRSGLEEDHIAGGLALLTAAYLIQGQHAQFLCNFILITVPLLLTYVYIKERPPTSHLLVYWASFSILTLLDEGFEEFVIAYYVVKILLLALLFLKPFCYVNKIVELLKQVEEEAEKHENSTFNPDQINELEKRSAGRKSPPPEKPEQEDQKLVKQSSNSLRIRASDKDKEKEKSPSLRQKPDEPKTAKSKKPTNAEEKAPSDRQPPSPSPAGAGAPAGPPGAPAGPPGAPLAASTSETNTAAAITPIQPKTDRDAMLLNQKKFELRSGGSSVEEDGIETRGANAPVNLHDFCTQPLSKLVFNAPFDMNVLSYYMTVYNNTPRNMAFAIKSNAIPRLTANPPCGVLKPRQKMMIWVNVQPFKFDEVDVSRDRIAFDYVFCKPEVDKFTHSLLQGHETRRRKNMFVQYNA